MTEELKLKYDDFLVGAYLLKNNGAGHLATFPIVAGLMWTGRGGGGNRRASRGWPTHSCSIGSTSPSVWAT